MEITSSRLIYPFWWWNAPVVSTYCIIAELIWGRAMGVREIVCDDWWNSAFCTHTHTHRQRFVTVCFICLDWISEVSVRWSGWRVWNIHVAKEIRFSRKFCNGLDDDWVEFVKNTAVGLLLPTHTHISSSLAENMFLYLCAGNQAVNRV